MINEDINPVLDNDDETFMFVHDDGKFMYEKNALKEGLPYTSYTSSLQSVCLNQSLYISTFPIKTDEDQMTVPIFICDFSLDADDLAIFLLLIYVRIFGSDRSPRCSNVVRRSPPSYP